MTISEYVLSPFLLSLFLYHLPSSLLSLPLPVCFSPADLSLFFIKLFSALISLLVGLDLQKSCLHGTRRTFNEGFATRSFSCVSLNVVWQTNEGHDRVDPSPYSTLSVLSLQTGHLWLQNQNQLKLLKPKLHPSCDHLKSIRYMKHLYLQAWKIRLGPFTTKMNLAYLNSKTKNDILQITNLFVSFTYKKLS